LTYIVGVIMSGGAPSKVLVARLRVGDVDVSPRIENDTGNRKRARRVSTVV